MAWLEVSVEVDEAGAEALSDALLEAGALSAMVEDARAGTEDETPLFGEPGDPPPGGFRRSLVTALLPLDRDPIATLAAAAEAAGIPPLGQVTLARVEDEDWVRRSQAEFAPIRVSPRIWIVPSWHQPPDPEALNLLIDPGLAFGTGSHPTTRMCLNWLEERVEAGCSVLDYGCGSGILAIAAARLGATRVVGVDIDPPAVDAAAANAATNGAACAFGLPELAAGRAFDRVVANILANPLRVLAPALAAHVRPGGEIALAGLLADQAAELCGIYGAWFDIAEARSEEGWSLLTGVRRPG